MKAISTDTVSVTIFSPLCAQWHVEIRALRLDYLHQFTDILKHKMLQRNIDPFLAGVDSYASKRAEVDPPGACRVRHRGVWLPCCSAPRRKAPSPC